VHESYYQKELPSAIFDYEKERVMLFPVKEIVTDEAAAQKVEHSIEYSISKEALKLVRLCFISNMENREIAILNFLRLGYKVGELITDMLAHDVVRIITKSAGYVQSESHKYKGFLRFSEYDGALAAIIEPKNFVLPVIAPHFCDRLSNEHFMIYDKTHKYAFIYQNGEGSLIKLEHMELPEAGPEEEKYRALWRQFYKTIVIEGRTNTKLRMNHMPKRYWEHLTEFEG